MSNAKVTTPAEHRALLLRTMEGILEGKVSVPMANALASVSAEVHKNLKQEWEMRCYASENLTFEHGNIVKMIGSE